MSGVLRAATVVALVSTCVGAQARGKWTRIDDLEQKPKSVPLSTCPSLKSQTSRPPVHAAGRVETEVIPIGTVQTFKIYDVIHRFSNIDGKGWSKRIFVERSGGQFCEIYRTEGSEFTHYEPGRSFIFAADGGQLLGTRCEWTGSYHMVSEANWIFDSDGPIEVNLDEVVSAAIKAAVPESHIVNRVFENRFGVKCYVVDLWTNRGGASLYVKFAVKGTSLTLIDAKFDPEYISASHEKECPRN